MYGRPLLCVALFLAGSLSAFGDFKYTQSSKMTGGAMSGAMKIAGVFSKQAREPMVTTTSVKGNRLRTDNPNGQIQIIDLEGRRFINIDSQKRTYSVVTFDEMRAAMERAKQRAQERTHQKPQDQNLKVVPKIQVTPTDNTKVLLNQTTHEVQVRLDMEMQSEDPNQKTQSASMFMTTDSWIAPSLRGADEVQQFHAKMAQELNWVPGAMFGETPQMQDAMAEFQKNSSALKGFPLEQFVSFGMEGTGQGAATSGNQTQGGGSTTTESGGTQSSGGGLAGLGKKSLGGMLGGFGKKKKADETSSGGTTNPSGGSTAQSGANGGSLMDMTVEVTEYSSDLLDPSLFEIPAGYTEVKADADKLAQGHP